MNLKDYDSGHTLTADEIKPFLTTYGIETVVVAKVGNQYCSVTQVDIKRFDNKNVIVIKVKD